MGIKALESDERLDLIDALRNTNFTDQTLSLRQLINMLKEKGLIGATFADIDFLYDNTVIALTELYYLIFEDRQTFNQYDGENASFFTTLETITATKEELMYLQKYITNIYNEVPGRNCEREYIALFMDKNIIKKYLQSLLAKLAEEIAKLNSTN